MQPNTFLAFIPAATALWEKWSAGHHDWVTFLACVQAELRGLSGLHSRKCNGVTLGVQGGKPWIMWDESEPERRIRVSQWVTRRWGCLLAWVQEKFSRIALGKLGRQRQGRENWRVGTDENMGERVKLVGRRSPNREWELPGKEWEHWRMEQHSLRPWTRFEDMRDSLLSLYNWIMSSDTFLFKAPAPKCWSRARAPPPTVPCRARVWREGDPRWRPWRG